MRLLFSLLIMIFMVTAIQAQKKKGTEKAPATQPTQQTQPTQTKPADTAPGMTSEQLTQHFLKKYAAAARWNDYETVKDALYDLIVENPTNDSVIYTLAYYYYENQKYASSLLISTDLLNKDPKNPLYLEIAASSAEEVGVLDRALQNYESLFLLTNNTRTLYQIAFIQYNLKRYEESTANIGILLAKPEVTTLNVVFNDPAGNPKEYQMKVAILNLKGLIAMDQKDNEGAKKAFSDALAIAADFVPAKQNLDKLKK